MAKLSKECRSLKLTPGKVTQLTKALDDIESHVGKVADIWRSLPQTQRDEVLANSPIFAKFLEIAKRFF